jgi:hypothetical protein
VGALLTFAHEIEIEIIITIAAAWARTAPPPPRIIMSPLADLLPRIIIIVVAVVIA